MSLSSSFRRSAPLPIVLFAALVAWTSSVAAQRAPLQPENRYEAALGNYDIRLIGDQELAAVRQSVGGDSRSLAATSEMRNRAFDHALDRLREESAYAEAQRGALGMTEVVSARRGALTAGELGRSPSDLALSFLIEHADLYGIGTNREALTVVGESLSPTGLGMVRLEQRVGGLPVFQGEMKVFFDRQNRVRRTVGRLVPGSSRTAAPAFTLSAEESLNHALSDLGINLERQAIRRLSADHLAVSSTRVRGPVKSWQVLFPLAGGELVPAWAHITFTDGPGDWISLHSAVDGTLLWRKNIRSHLGATEDAERLTTRGAPSLHDARFSVYVQADGVTPADNPAPLSPTTLDPGDGTQPAEIARTVVSMLDAYDSAASPEGWLANGVSTTTGNNVDAYLDTDADNLPDALLDATGRPTGNPDTNGRDRDFLGSAPRDYDYTPAPSAGDPDAGDAPLVAPFRRGAVTQLFYVTNWYHDRLHSLGFDEASGNFEEVNSTGQGSGGDRVLAEAHDGSGTNNANFSTPPDGSSGRMQMFVFDGSSPDRDGSLDAEIVIHELTHGTSNRLVGNGTGLNWAQGGAMGEGWSDFYALALLNPTAGDAPGASYASGAYATYQLAGLTDNYLYGIRRFPYSTDNAVNPLTFGDTDNILIDTSGGITTSPLDFNAGGASEVHNAGEVWALALWEVRQRIIEANGDDVALGNEIMLQLVTDGLKMTPADPTFIDARDAILDADCATNACANEGSIWAGFADRGLGFGATTSRAASEHYGVKESFDVPQLEAAMFSIDDSVGNGNGFPEPGERIRLTVTLRNPWSHSSRDIAGATATLSTVDEGSILLGTIYDDSAAFGPIAAGGQATGDSFEFVLPAIECGRLAEFVIDTSSSLGSGEVAVSIWLGGEVGPGTPSTYTRDLSTPLSIPDGRGSGAFDTLNVPDTFKVTDADVRIDGLSHTWVGDLTVMPRAPNGFGTDVIYRLAGACEGSLALGGNCGEDFTDTTIDGDSANDLLVATETQAPFTGSWLPSLNSPALSGSDPVDQMAGYEGDNAAGDWHLFVADHVSPDPGTLDEWSLVLTPASFACADTGILFADSFESSDTSEWSSERP